MKKITKQDPQSESLDIVADNIEKLLELFPEIRNESNNQKEINFDVLQELLGNYIDDKEERYNFTWYGKYSARRLAQTPSTGTLRPCIEDSVEWDKSKNIFIEGDNLEVLKLLQKSYHKKIKMIYIDPPYNTGNEFIYPDKYQDNLDTYLRYTSQIDDEGLKISSNTESSGRYHTNWLNMMYPRLKLARNLLKDDGVIFISIGENEIKNLRLICDEIFGEENFVSTIIWEKRYSPQNAVKWFSESHDFILVYAKTKLNWHPKLLERTEAMNARYRNLDNDPRGVWKPADATAQAGHGTKSQFYILTAPNGKQHALPNGRCWVYTEPVFQQMVADNRIWFGADGNNVPAVKRFLSEVKQGTACQTIWKYSEVGHNQEGKKEVNELFPESTVFETPKPVRLLSRILHLSTEEDSIILDFFAGSATTAHAVMQMNTEDAGNRKFIMVQLPEPCQEKSFAFKAGYRSIAEISKERIRRAANKLKEEKPTFKGDLGFKAFKLDATNINSWNADFETLEDELALSIDSVKPERTNKDVLYEILLKYGLDLTLPIEELKINDSTAYSIGMGALIVCLVDAITIETVEGIGKLKAELKPEVMRVVFKDAGFANDVVKTNAVQVLKQFGIDDVRSI